MIALLSSCTNDDVTGLAVADAVVEADLMLGVSAPQQGVTRMADAVTQVDGSYRGLGSMTIIPFAIPTDRSLKKVLDTDRPKAFAFSGIEQQTDTRFYYYPRCTFMSGVNAVLCYAQPAKDENVSKAENGSLQVLASSTMYPEQISFAPDPIYSTFASVIPEPAQVIADYLTSIARARTETIAWSGDNTEDLNTLYQNFIYHGPDLPPSNLMPGSYASVIGHVNGLRWRLNNLELPEGSELVKLRQAINDSINKVPAHIDTRYPESIGMPAGSAVLRWMGDRFMPQTERNTVADINSIDRFAYPAELWYFANSTLRTSVSEMPFRMYEAVPNWQNLLALYLTGNQVTTSTKSVAVVDPLQYGVASLKMVLKKLETTTLLDYKDQSVSIKTADGGDAFPLTGVIVSGQREVDFTFLPKSTDETKDYFVYDNQVGNVVMSVDRDQSPVHTLLLQTPAAMKVRLLLEFVNNSGQDFYGNEGGIIYNGSKFYLLGVIDPLEKDKNDHIRPQAFTRDEFTEVSAKISSLAKAYNVMPNLLNPRLEIGIQLSPQWIVTEPTNVEFY